MSGLKTKTTGKGWQGPVIALIVFACLVFAVVFSS